MRTSVLLLSFSLALSLFAQSPYLVKDINTTSGAPVSSSPHDFAVLGNKTLFAATSPANGDELWVTDGTSGGTVLLADIIPGPGDSRPLNLVAFNGKVLFAGNDGTHGVEYWTSDGTPAGTHLLVDINPADGASSSPGKGIVYNNRLYFSAFDGLHGQELWSTDGTAAGTRMVKDLNPGTASALPFALTVFNDSLYFGAFDGFYKTDGTDAGTVKIGSVRPFGLTAIGSKLYMSGFTSDSDIEPWISDGTAAGTRMIMDVNPGAATSSAAEFTQAGDKVVFLADDGVHGREMWVTDGTAAGTHLIRDFLPGSLGMWGSTAPSAYLTAFNGRAFFQARDADHGYELWSTDGTDAGTALFDDLVPGPTSSGPTDLLVFNGKLLFVAGPFLSSKGRLWVSDGTVAGTRSIGDASGPAVAPTPGFTQKLWPTGGKLYFGGFDYLNGVEPWVTTNGNDVHRIANIDADAAASSSPELLTATDNLLFFWAREGLVDALASRSLWRTDGTADGTFKLLETKDSTEALTAAGPVVLLNHVAPDDPRTQHLVSDGTIAGTQPWDSYMTRFGGGSIYSVFEHGATLFANINHGDVSNLELWAAPAATSERGVNLGVHSAFSLTDFAGNVAYLTGYVNDFTLGTSDGTPAGTFAIAPVSSSSEHPQLVSMLGTLYFLTLKDGSTETRQLWKSDGTPDGTMMVVQPVTQGISYYAPIKVVGRKVFFVTGGSLWASDGTAAGTIELVPLATTSLDTDILKAAGTHLVWTTWTQTGGTVLWTSDGTKDGTKQLMNLGAPQYKPTEIDGLVFFPANDADHGIEIWSSDGTPEGTKLYVDLNPGPASSNPTEFAKVGNLLYVSATTAATGAELWAIPLTDPAISIGDARVKEGDSGTSSLRFTVSLNTPSTQNVTLSYATADGTAVAGQDYDAATGSLTFAPGETSKTIDVAVRGDAAPENNETFSLALGNVKGARVIRGEAGGVIEDDDQLADLAVRPAFTVFGGLSDGVSITNGGPRTATDVKVTLTSTPAASRRDCGCVVAPLANGASTTTQMNDFTNGFQMFLSATVTARQRDPQPANNSASWTVSGDAHMAMNAAYLVTGQTATITVAPASSSLTSSDPSVASVSATSNGTATVTANKAGTTNITYLPQQQYPLQVFVVDPGTQMRWPGGVTFQPVDFPDALFGIMTLNVAATGTAPFTGAKPTGTVVVTADGHEIGSQPVNGNSFAMPVIWPRIGTMPYVVSYSGDANFLPVTISRTVNVLPGRVTITGDLRPTTTAGTYQLNVAVTGSPAHPPSGTLSVRNQTGNEIATVALVASTGGTSTAQTTLTNLQPSATVMINYPGDSFYLGANQQIRVVEPHQRTVRH